MVWTVNASSVTTRVEPSVESSGGRGGDPDPAAAGSGRLPAVLPYRCRLPVLCQNGHRFISMSSRTRRDWSGDNAVALEKYWNEKARSRMAVCANLLEPNPKASASVLGVVKSFPSATATRMARPCRFEQEIPVKDGTRHSRWTCSTLAARLTDKQGSRKRPFAGVAKGLRLPRAERQHWERAGASVPATAHAGKFRGGPASLGSRLSAYRALVGDALMGWQPATSRAASGR
jgi:hypothetical protein